jgi:hypothetical protein
MDIETANQLASAYRRMAEGAKYRPEAPSDGFGHIVGPLNLKREEADFAFRFAREEDRGRFDVGYPGFSARPALVFLVEAARTLCGCDYEVAARLARMAARDLDKLARDHPKTW